MRSYRLLAGSVALVWMLLVQPALGATVGVFKDTSFRPDIRYQAAVGELNALSIVEEAGGVYMITDLGADITPLTPECVSISPNVVRCQVGPFPIGTNDDRAWFYTNDGADRVDVDSYGAFVDGGAGPDTLTGTEFSQTLVGGLGEDTLLGGPGPQVLRGGEGADLLNGGPGWDKLQGGAGTDVIAGGSGRDEVSYRDHTEAVRISLDGRANDGAAGEDDWVRADVEGAYGSRGRTIFIGNIGPNTYWGNANEGDFVRSGGGNDYISAGNGPNVLLGGRGDDSLGGGRGRDVMSGGPGDDFLTAYGRADVIRGGPGNDSLYGRSGADDLAGGRGNDRVRGGLGHDMLRGGPGRDHLIGDCGADVFYARDRNRDRVDGGAGPDRAQVDPIDRLFLVELLF